MLFRSIGGFVLFNIIVWIRAAIKGDTKWIPYGWSMSAKNIDTGYQKSWSIGNVNGIKQAKTFRMYIFFQKYIYNGSEWEATGVKEALPTEFKSKAIDFTVTPSGTITPTATAGSGSGGYDYNGTGSGDGDGTDGDDAENHDGTDSDTGSTSARSEERRVGKECSEPCRSRWSPYH